MTAPSGLSASLDAARVTWTPEAVAALPVTVDLMTAASVIGIGRSGAYDLAGRGEFPVPVLKVGTRYRVVTAHLRDLLGLTR